jgi:hypothetical protein
MKMTAATIIAEARSQWNEPSAAFITDAEALRWLNLAQADFVRKTKCLRYTWTFSTAANQQDYPFPLDARVMEMLWVLCESLPLWPVTIAELDAFSTSWRQTAGGPTGQPDFYYVSGIHDSEMGFFNCPDDIYIISAYYVEDPPLISLTSEYPKIQETYHDLLMLYVESRGHRKNRDYQQAQTVQAEYNTEVERARVQFTSLQPERIITMSGPEYRTPKSKIGWPQFPKNYGYES